MMKRSVVLGVIAAMFVVAIAAQSRPWGGRNAIHFENNDFVHEGVSNGRTYRARINGGQVTGGIVILVTLFAASPIRRHGLTYVKFLLAAAGGVFTLHAVSVVLLIDARLLALPSASASNHLRAFLHFYARSHSYIGLYAPLIVFWCPYILVVVPKHGARIRALASHGRHAGRVSARP